MHIPRNASDANANENFKSSSQLQPPASKWAAKSKKASMPTNPQAATPTTAPTVVCCKESRLREEPKIAAV